MKNKIINANGSIQTIEVIPQTIRDVFKTAFELKQRTIIDMAAARAPFIDQAQSMNLFFTDLSHKKMTGALMHAWKLGLKNGIYYCRTPPAAQAAKLTANVDVSSEPTTSDSMDACPVGCTSCAC